MALASKRDSDRVFFVSRGRLRKERSAMNRLFDCRQIVAGVALLLLEAASLARASHRCRRVITLMPRRAAQRSTNARSMT